MSFNNFEDATNEIIKFFDDAWGSDRKALYPNVTEEIPTGQEEWARLNIQFTSGRQVTMGGIGCRRFRRLGIVFVQVFSPKLGEGLSDINALAKIVSDAFEGKATANGVWFRNVSPPLEAAGDGDFYQANISVDFEFDEIK